MIKRLLIIPARKGSKRIKNKNTKKFYGKPIIEYGLENAIKSKIFHRIHISSNDKNLAKKYNVKNKYLFLRPENLSKDNVPLTKVISFVLKKFENLGEEFDEIWMLLPCSPLIEKITFLKAKKIMEKKNSKAFTTVGKSRVPFYWYYKMKNKNLVPFFNKNWNKPSQKLKETFYEIGVLAGWKTNYFKKCIKFNKRFIYSPLILDFFQSFDIDTVNDLKIVKSIYKYKLHRK